MPPKKNPSSIKTAKKTAAAKVSKQSAWNPTWEVPQAGEADTIAWEPALEHLMADAPLEERANPAPKALAALVIEDNPESAELFADALRDAKWSVKTAVTAAEARYAYQAGVYDLITLDINLPDGSGLEVCRWLRAQPGGDLPFILAMTARSGMNDLTEILKAGANDYLAKPFEIQALLVRLAVAHNQILLLQQQAWLSSQMQTVQNGFRALFEHPNDLNFIVTFEGAVLGANSAGQVALGKYDFQQSISTIADIFQEKEMPVLDELIGQEKKIRAKIAGNRTFNVWGQLIPWQGRQALLLNLRGT